jgi:DNA-binding transcriptional MerR regulator
MGSAVWKVGELARRTGLTVRALHHYDEIGLLVPSHHTDSGHRLYTPRDVERLQRILSLRQLGCGLDQIRAYLASPDFSPKALIESQIAQIDERIEGMQALRNRLQRLGQWISASAEVGVEEFLELIEEMNMIEKYYTPEQLEQLKARGEAIGPERIRAVEAEWPVLMAEVQGEIDKGTDPTEPRVQNLARRWMGLVEEFTGGDPGITQSVKRMYQNETTVHGMDTANMRGMMAYIQKAIAAAKTPE